jgi:hypothetical protein
MGATVIVLATLIYSLVPSTLAVSPPIVCATTQCEISFNTCNRNEGCRDLIACRELCLDAHTSKLIENHCLETCTNAYPALSKKLWDELWTCTRVRCAVGKSILCSFRFPNFLAVSNQACHGYASVAECQSVEGCDFSVANGCVTGGKQFN